MESRKVERREVTCRYCHEKFASASKEMDTVKCPVCNKQYYFVNNVSIDIDEFEALDYLPQNNTFAVSNKYSVKTLIASSCASVIVSCLITLSVFFVLINRVHSQESHALEEVNNMLISLQDMQAHAERRFNAIDNSVSRIQDNFRLMNNDIKTLNEDFLNHNLALLEMHGILNIKQDQGQPKDVSEPISGNVIAALRGSGTEEDPYLIQSRADFDEFSNPKNAATYWAKGIHTKLMCDLDLTGITYTRAVIGPSDSLRYSGIFDGNGKVISNLTIYKTSSTRYGGLFGFLWFGQVRNLGLRNVKVNCPSSMYVGGLVGRVLDSRVISCYTTGSVRGNQRVGGLAGQSGGRSGLINCYSTASVNGSYIVGGLVGWVSGRPRFCYSTGRVIGDTHVGGLMGYGYRGTTRAESCFWDIRTSGMGRGAGYGSSEQIYGKTTAEMKTLRTFTNDGWNFSKTDDSPAVWWMPSNSYPRLIWERR